MLNAHVSTSQLLASVASRAKASRSQQFGAVSSFRRMIKERRNSLPGFSGWRKASVTAISPSFTRQNSQPSSPMPGRRRSAVSIKYV